LILFFRGISLLIFTEFLLSTKIRKNTNNTKEITFFLDISKIFIILFKAIKEIRETESNCQVGAV